MAAARLPKELTLRDVYTIATGATLSAGLFLLPGLAAAQAGPAIVLCYMLAAVPLVPAMLAVVELATAMPRAGGAYYFLDRSLGPLAGTIGGLGTWLALVLKTAFALVGIGAYSALIFGESDPMTMRAIAAGFAVLFGLLNAAGSKKTGKFQFVLVMGLLIVLSLFMGRGIPEIDYAAFQGFFGAGTEGILATAGLVYISYVGITNVASVSEEVRDPERNLPKGVFLSLGTSLLVYAVCTTIMVGVLPAERLAGDMTPMASAAEAVFGKVGLYVMTLGAFLAFFSVSNAGILSSSRYPLAMGRDRLVPEGLAKLSKRGTPVRSIALTVTVIVAILLFLEPIKIAKLASAFQLMMFALLCLAVIVMRESGLASYDPGFRAPFYPGIHIFGIVAPFVLIGQMGLMPTLFSAGLILFGGLWYSYYGSKRVNRQGAIYHMFARLGKNRHDPLDVELRTILKEKGLRDQDPFEEAVLEAHVIDADHIESFDSLIARAAQDLAPRLGVSVDRLVTGFTEGTATGATPVSKGVALPHMHLPNIDHPTMVLVRTQEEIQIVTGDVFGAPRTADKIHAVFFLVSPEGDPGQHLRMLAQLATRIDQSDFIEHWLAAKNEVQLREVFLRSNRYISIRIRSDHPTSEFLGHTLQEIDLPEQCLVAALRRGGETLVPRGTTSFELGDRLLVIGDPPAIEHLHERFGLESKPPQES